MSWGFNENYGQVSRLYSATDGVLFQLKGGRTAMNPEYYFIKKTHSNYNALAALLYLAANSRYTIKVRCVETGLVNGLAEVVYLVVDW